MSTPLSKLQKAFAVQSPHFRPLWLRIVIVAFCFGWAVLELVKSGSFNWAAVSAGAGVYLAYQFFVVFDPDADHPDD
ncbi:MAG: hypothetical protein ABJO67_06365 [Pseudoruegeria sp.]